MLQLAAGRAEAARWHELQAANNNLLSEREGLLAELAKSKALYEADASRANALQASRNTLQTELTKTQLELQVGSLTYVSIIQHQMNCNFIMSDGMSAVLARLARHLKVQVALSWQYGCLPVLCGGHHARTMQLPLCVEYLCRHCCPRVQSPTMASAFCHPGQQGLYTTLHPADMHNACAGGLGTRPSKSCACTVGQ